MDVLMDVLKKGIDQRHEMDTAIMLGQTDFLGGGCIGRFSTDQ
jgi:hypothetical protein